MLNEFVNKNKMFELFGICRDVFVNIFGVIISITYSLGRVNEMDIGLNGTGCATPNGLGKQQFYKQM